MKRILLIGAAFMTVTQGISAMVTPQTDKSARRISLNTKNEIKIDAIRILNLTGEPISIMINKRGKSYCSEVNDEVTELRYRTKNGTQSFIEADFPIFFNFFTKDRNQIMIREHTSNSTAKSDKVAPHIDYQLRIAAENVSEWIQHRFLENGTRESILAVALLKDGTINLDKKTLSVIRLSRVKFQTATSETLGPVSSIVLVDEGKK